MTPSVELHSNVRKDGRQLIQIKVSHGKERKRISTEIYVKKSDFKKGAKWGKWIKESHIDASKLNSTIESKLIQIKEHYNKSGSINPKVAIKGEGFFAYSYDFIERYNNQRSLATYRAYKAKLSKLKAYAGDKITFSDITVAFIRGYINHLKKPVVLKDKTIPGNTVNTIAVDLRKIKAIFNQAIKEGLIDATPFRMVEIQTEKTKKAWLTSEELRAMRSLDLESSHENARDIFIFCINCSGMRIGDALRLKNKDVQEDKLNYQMNKTQHLVTLKLSTDAKSIISKYAGNGEYIFPYLQKGCDEFKVANSATAVINNCLKSIAGMAGIDKNLSTHVARHTWTQLAIEKGGNPRTIQKALRHHSFSTTESYLADLNTNTDVDDLNESIFKS